MGVSIILGNLVVLCIMAVTLVLFRKTDKNNKSLEQVKKYASKRNEDFEQYLEQKLTDIKDLSISLDVQEKTSTVILNRICNEVDSLSEKITHIEELNKKVTGYNSTMDKMLNLSKELDERYGNLKKDSIYLDQIDKKVKDGSKKIQAVEKNIQDITTEFIKNNNNSIEKLKEEIFIKTNKEVEGLNLKITSSLSEINSLDSKIDDLTNKYNTSAKENYDKLKEDLQRLVETHRDNFTKITEDGNSFEVQSFNELKEKINIRSSNLETILDDKLKLIDEQNSEKISKLSMDMGNVEFIANKIKEENQHRLDSIKNQIDKQLLLLKEVNSKGVESLQEEFSQNFREFKELSFSEFNKTKVESELILNDLKKNFNEAKEYRDEVINTISSTDDYLNNEISDLKDRLDGSIYQITRELDSHEEKIKTAAFEQLEKNLEVYKREIQEKIDNISSVKNNLSEMKIDFEESIIETKNSLTLELENINIDIQNKKDELFSKINEYNNILVENSELNKKIIEDDKLIIQNQSLALKDTLDKLTNDLKNNENEIRAQVILQRESVIESVNNDINIRLKNIKEELLTKINSLTNFEEQIDRVKIELDKYITEKHGKIEDEVKDFEVLINSKVSTEKDLLSSFVENFNAIKNSLENDIIELKNKSYNNISEKLVIFEDEYFAKLKDKQEYINKETDNWKEKLSQSINSIQIETNSSIIDNMEKNNIEINSFKKKIQDEYNVFKDELVKRNQDLLINISDLESNILKESQEFKESASKQISSLQSSLEKLESDISSKTFELNSSLKTITTEQERYLTETELFEKTDKLKKDLEFAIESLSDRLNEANSKSSFVDDTNKKLDSLKILIESINNQIESVDDKRIKIESLENRVSKVLELSDNVDDKLIRIKASEAHVSEIQLKLRELQELEDRVSLEFSRLENKENILEETNKAIDSGFSNIQLIENKMDILKENISPFNNQIENIKMKLGKIEDRESTIDKAISSLANLDLSISEMESKIDKMDKAREWIAGVETRLNESVRTADEQVKLMGALAQNKLTSNSKEGSSTAPKSDVREIVIKLAHNGWKAEDIARTTKLSRGEVELILELSPRK